MYVELRICDLLTNKCLFIKAIKLFCTLPERQLSEPSFANLIVVMIQTHSLSALPHATLIHVSALVFLNGAVSFQNNAVPAAIMLLTCRTLYVFYYRDARV